MIPLSVSGDYTIPRQLTFPTRFKVLLVGITVTSAAVLVISSAELCKASRYTSPIASTLNVIHSSSLYFLCRRELARDPVYAPRRMRRMPTTRRITIAATFALLTLWLVVIAILVLSTTGVIHDENMYPRARRWILAIIEVVGAGIQVLLLAALGVSCLQERQVALQGSRRRTGFG